jgi:hypothetical protein
VCAGKTDGSGFQALCKTWLLRLQLARSEKRMNEMRGMRKMRCAACGSTMGEENELSRAALEKGA